jgi:hypothetical protein
MWLLIGAAVAGVIIALVLVIPQAPVSERQGTAPSALDTQLQPSPCAGLPEPQKKRCFAEAHARSAATGPEPRDAISSTNTGRGARGSGVEGVTSDGTSHAPPTRR